MSIPNIEESLPTIITILCAIALVVAVIIRLKGFSSNTEIDDKKVKKSNNPKKGKSVSPKSNNSLSSKKLTEQQRQNERESITDNVTTEILLMDSDNDIETRTQQPAEFETSKVSSAQTSSYEPTPSPVSQPTSSVSSGSRSGGDIGGGGGYGGGDSSGGSSD